MRSSSSLQSGRAILWLLAAHQRNSRKFGNSQCTTVLHLLWWCPALLSLLLDSSILTIPAGVNRSKPGSMVTPAQQSAALPEGCQIYLSCTWAADPQPSLKPHFASLHPTGGLAIQCDNTYQNYLSWLLRSAGLCLCPCLDATCRKQSFTDQLRLTYRLRQLVVGLRRGCVQGIWFLLYWQC